MGAADAEGAMTEEEFSELLCQAFERAAKNAEEKLSLLVPRRFDVVVYGAGYSGVTMPPEQVARALYLEPSRFYRIVDVSVVAVKKDRCRIFLRVSGHPPGSFEETWNDPPGSGPFKQLIAQEIEVE